MGKGDRYRKVNQDKFNENFDRIFNKRGNKMSDINNESVVEQKYEDAVDEITSKTVDEFLTLCEDEGIKEMVPNIDMVIDEIATRWANGERS